MQSSNQAIEKKIYSKQSGSIHQQGASDIIFFYSMEVLRWRVHRRATVVIGWEFVVIPAEPTLGTRAEWYRVHIHDGRQ